MPYLVSDFQGEMLSELGDTRIFSSLVEVFRHLQKVCKNGMLMGEMEATLDLLSWVLKERHSTVLLREASERYKSWIITAF